MNNLQKNLFWSGNNPLPYFIILLTGYFLFMLIMPIKVGDTDMWYHLNGGRYFWETLTVPNTAFFSFIEPSREWTNYFWGFQALIYKIFEYFDYQGLVILRLALASATVFMAVVLLNRSFTPQNSLILLLIFAAILLVYDGRAYQLRPHLFSYLFILLFFYILEHKPKLAPALPFITIVWANLHGVEWPVPALICGSYALPVIIKLLSKQDTGLPNPSIYLVSIFLCALAFLLNPHGWELYLAPFKIDSDTYLYIGELIKVQNAAISTLELNGLNVPLHTALTFIFFITVAFFITGLIQKHLPLPQAILYVGGVFLLFRGSRFIWEWLLLCIPLITFTLKNNTLLKQQLIVKALPRHASFIIILILIAATLYEKSRLFGSYPFDNRHLPTGLAAFIQKTDGTGSVLAPPSIAGYVEWETYPQLKTFIDMQFPPSTDMDMFQVSQAYGTEFGLKQFIKAHNPDWILVPVNHNPASKNIKTLENYAPVFTDDVLVLYADRTRHQQIAEDYELKQVNPHQLLDRPDQHLRTYLAELQRLFAISPSIARVNQALASYYLDNKNIDAAMQYADHFTETSPFDPNSHYLLGITLQHAEKFDDAIQRFQDALPLANDSSRHKIETALATTYYLKQNFSKAYQFFNISVNAYSKLHKPDVLYMYALSATIEGQLQKAEKLLAMILYSANPEEHQDIIEQTTNLRQKINEGDFDAPSFFKWAFDSLTGT